MPPGTKVAGAYAEIGAKTDEYERKMRQAGQTFSNTVQKIQQEGAKMVQTISQTLDTLPAGLGQRAFDMARQVYDMAELGASAERAEEAFRRLAGTRADEMFGRLTTTARGTISEMDLMAAASRAMRLEAANNAEDMDKLLQVAKVRGREMGLTTTQAFNDIVTGIGRASPLILDNLGIVIDSKTAYENYARSIGTTVDALSELERKTAIREAIFAATPEAFAGIPPDAMENFERAKAAVTDIRVEMGKIMAMEFSGGMATMADSLSTFGDTVGSVREFKASVEELVAPVSNFIDRIDTGNEVFNIFVHNLLRLDMKGLYTDLIATGFKELPTVIDAATGAVDSLTPAADEASVALTEQAQAASVVTKELMSLKDAWDIVNSVMPLSFDEVLDISKARFGYEWSKADTRGRIGMLVKQITAAEVGSVEYYNLLKQLTEQEQRYRRETESTTSSLRARRDVLSNQSDAAFRSLVEGVLSPTRVTDLDMARTQLGTYTDQWDEHIRRVRSAATDSKSAWRDLIPVDVMARGADAVKVWAAETEEAFYAGQMPDQVNWDAVMADVEKQMRYQAGREALVQEAMQRARAAGLAASAGQVREALGVQDPGAAGLDTAQSFTAGLTKADQAAQLTASFEEDLQAQQERWVAMGVLAVGWWSTGVKKGGASVARDMAMLLAPYLQAALAERSPYP